MRTPKDRLYRVLVIGATPAGIAATNKLGEMGVPVTLIDTEGNLDAKLSHPEWRLASGLTLNYALRPGLLRILRNPRIRALLPAAVQGLKHTPQGFSARVRVEPTYVDPDQCVLCGRCLEVCPAEGEDGARAICFGGRRALPGRAAIDKRRQPLCQANCPLGVNAQGYVALTRAGRFAEALELIRRDNVLPGICGRVCHHPCEAACRRSELDQPVAIREIKRFLADQAGSSTPVPIQPKAPTRGETVAVIGSGPAGLAAAADLARSGRAVTVFEKEAHPGGLLRYGIGAYRLPRRVIESDLAYIEALGVRFETHHPIDLDRDLARLREDFDAVLITTGNWHDRRLGVPGEDLEGVVGCIEYLHQCYCDQPAAADGAATAVIGDGNAAFDLARALLRQGAPVTMISWFPRELIPADAAEMRSALDEGVTILDRAQVVEFLGDGERLRGLRCIPTEPGPPDANGIPWPVPVPGGSPFELPFTRAVLAVGQAGAGADGGAGSGLKRSARGFLEVAPDWETSVSGVYAAGDAVTGPSSVVQAMASGRAAAAAVNARLGLRPALEATPIRPQDLDFRPITESTPTLPRTLMPQQRSAVCVHNFSEVALGFSEPQARQEAARCLQCGVCSECLQCVEVCRGPAAIRHHEQAQDLIEQAGVVIVADQNACPPIKGEDVLRAYGPKATTSDVYAMMLRGFAAAAEAMILLGKTPERLKGRGLSFAPPDPALSPEVRVGVFVCRCNDALGWAPELDRELLELTGRPEVVVSTTLDAACTPQGISDLLHRVRDQGITRIVLASCVCCPLDFVCSACTDQRSRLKDALFTGTGVSRSMVETCNMRGEVLRLLKSRPDLARIRFRGLLDRSISRARRLAAPAAPARPYNFTTAVIGDSEAAVTSALTLARAGMEVFVLGSPGRPLGRSLDHPNVHNFMGSMVRGIQGTVGNFRVLVEMDGSLQSREVGAVILGEQARRGIPYMPLAQLPPRLMEYGMQKQGMAGVPFLHPGATSIPGLFLANPPAIRVSSRVKGTAAAIMAAAVMPRRPRQNKGYTVQIDAEQCRGCGRCLEVCPYQAVSFRKNAAGGWSAVVDRALCKGCGNCISVCPSTAADSPYRDRRYLEQMLAEILV